MSYPVIVTEDPQHPYGLKVNGEVRAFATTAELNAELDRIEQVNRSEMARTRQRRFEEADGQYRKSLWDLENDRISAEMQKRDQDRGITPAQRLNRANSR